MNCIAYYIGSIYGFRACVLSDDATRELAVDILNELDWCLDQLESMQTHRSVSDMTTTKVSPPHAHASRPPEN